MGVVGMARKPRELVETGCYHVVLKGSGNQIIFEDDADRESFLLLLREYRQQFAVRIIAWCLMSNHVHLVMFDDWDNLSPIMHALASAYASRFNRIHGRSGALFGGRFHSVPIWSDAQLLRAVRYVHDNPYRAGMPLHDLYVWSSDREYRNPTDAMCDVRPVFDLLGGPEQYSGFCRDPNYEGYVYRDRAHLDDDDALLVARQLLGIRAIESLKSEDRPTRNQGLQRLRDAGLLVKQIERITGVGRGIIYRNTHG